MIQYFREQGTPLCHKTIFMKAGATMKSTGIVRNIDELGRVVVPKEIRQRMGIANNDPVEIYIEGDKVILTKYAPVCHFCGSSDGVTDFKGKKICKSCIDDLVASTK